MDSETTEKEIFAARTHKAYLWIHALSTPVWALFNLLPFILYKDLHASVFQTATLVTLKPLVSLLSVYWGASLNKRRDLLLKNVILARIISLIPFFFFPFVDNIWFFIAVFSLYMLLARGVVPAWMEILKLNLPKERMGSTFAKGSLLGHCGNIIFPLLIGWLLDDYFQAWRWLFPLTALISMSAVFLTLKIPIPKDFKPEEPVVITPSESLTQRILMPWKNSWQILTSHANYWKFQWGFMLGGAGTMLPHAVLPAFFVDILNLSFTEFTFAFSCCKGIGLVLTTPIWIKLINKIDIFRFSSWPPFWVCLYAICLLSAQIHLGWLFVGYLCYGIMEGGSTLSWNLSGPIFSKEQDSPDFSNVNVLAVGIRACIFPPLGALLGQLLGAPTVIVMGGLLCMFAHLTFLSYSRSEKEVVVEA
ncbi:MAG: MFS transporter [Parachlamydiaceae bacterium]|nr:MFS transporter [Parachlamydiaceae bacterium]